MSTLPSIALPTFFSVPAHVILLSLLMKVNDSTGLWLVSHDYVDDASSVYVKAAPEFARKASDDQERAIRSAYDQYLGLRTIYHVDAKATLRLRVEVQLKDLTFDFDGSLFQRN